MRIVPDSTLDARRSTLDARRSTRNLRYFSRYSLDTNRRSI